MKPLIFILKVIFIFQGFNSYAVYHKLGDYHSGGRMVSIDIKDDFVYTARYNGLIEIINISDPEQPHIVGNIQLSDYVPGVAGKIVVSDTFAFVLGQSNIHIIDITHSSSPTYLGIININMASDIIVCGSIAYIAGYNSFYIYDISNIQSPQLLSSLYGQLDGICLHDALIYGVHSSSPNNLRIINVSDLQNPYLVNNEFNLPIGSNADIDFLDFNVFIVHSSNMWTIDVNDPINPVILDTLKIENHSNKIYIKNSIAIVNNSSSGFKVIDLSNPANLTTIGYYDTPGSSSNLVATNNIVYVADGYYGLQIIDISDNTNSSLISHFQTVSQAKGMDISGDFLYLADEIPGLDVINISDVYDPTLLGTFFNGIGSPDNVCIKNNNLCFSKTYPTPELLLIDISIPEYPDLIHQFDLPFVLGSIALFQTNTHLFVGVGETLQIYDIIDFSNPIMISEYATPTQITDIVVKGDIGYISMGAGGVEIIDFENINSPQYLSSYYSSGTAAQIIIHSETLIISAGNGGIEMVDISNPASPYLFETIMPHINSNISVKPLIIDYKMVVVDREWNEIFTYNISDINNIQIINSVRINSEIYKVIYYADLLFCSINHYGMIILDNSIISSVDENKKYSKSIEIINIYPNPFESTTTISYSLLKKSRTNIEILNLEGKKIKSLTNKFENKGIHNIVWDGTDRNNNQLPNGIYFINIRNEMGNYIRKVCLAR